MSKTKKGPEHIYASTWWKASVATVWKAYFNKLIPVSPTLRKGARLALIDSMEKYAKDMAKYLNGIEEKTITNESVEEFGRKEIEIYDKYLNKIDMSGLGGAIKRTVDFLKENGLSKQISGDGKEAILRVIRLRNARILYSVITGLSYGTAKGIGEQLMQTVLFTIEH